MRLDCPCASLAHLVECLLKPALRDLERLMSIIRLTLERLGSNWSIFGLDPRKCRRVEADVGRVIVLRRDVDELLELRSRVVRCPAVVRGKTLLLCLSPESNLQ